VTGRDAISIGLIAGWGKYPVVIAEALRGQGYRTYCLGVLGHADQVLAEICDHFRWSGMARFGSAIRYFKRHGVSQATMAGKIQKQLMFHPWFVLRQLPDLKTIGAFLPHFVTRRKDCKDDTLLSRVVALFARDGIRFAPATDYAPELLVKEGQLTRRGPSSARQADIRFGWEIAKELGRLDCGQTVAVKNRAVLALEAVEGTDECIRRAGSLCPAGDFVVVKVAKPQQDMRFDVPTVGLRTLNAMARAGARVLAVEADRTVFLEQEEVIAFANRNRMVIVALTSPDKTA
jgi:DUF1009 family protein